MVDADLAVADEVFAGTDGFYEEFPHSKNVFSPDAKIFTYEMNRIGQALRVAGIDPGMLNKMQRSQVVRALMMDSTLFEEQGAMFKLFRQLHGIRDAVRQTGAEKAAGGLSSEQKEALETDWALRRKNLASFLYAMGGLYAADASYEELEAEVARYKNATPDFPGKVDTNYHATYPIPDRMLPMRGAVQNGLQSELQTMIASFKDQVGGMQVDGMDQSWVSIPKGGWVAYINEQRKAEQRMPPVSGQNSPSQMASVF